MDASDNRMRTSNSNDTFPKLKEKIPPDDNLFFDKLSWSKKEKTILKESNENGPAKFFKKATVNFSSVQERAPQTINRGFQDTFLSSKARIKKNQSKILKEKGISEKAQKEAKIVSFFSFLGKLLHVTNKAKLRLSYGKIYNLSEKQLELLGDRVYSIAPPNKSLATKSSTKNYLPRNSVFLTRVPTVLNYSSFSFKLLTAKINKKLKSLGKKIKMFHPLSRILMAWKAILCVFIILEFFNITIKLFFDRNWDRGYRFINQYETTLKSALIIDIFVVWNTGIFRSGAAIFERREALKYYLKAGLIQDLLALFALFLPLYTEESAYTGSSDNLPALQSSPKNLIKCLFIFKINQIMSVFTYLEEMVLTEEVYEGLLSLTKLFFNIILISHLIACFWNFAASCEKSNGRESWYDKIFFENDRTIVIDWSREYLFSWYWSLTTMITVGYGDISPKSDKEVAVASLAMLFGCGFFAYAISSIGLIVETFSLKKKQLWKDLRIINKYMMKKQVDFDLQVRVRKYLEHLWLEEEIENKEKEVNIMNKLSDSLREELLIQSNGRVLSKFNLFTKFFSSETLEKVAQIVGSVSYAPEDVIIYDGEQSNNIIYFITKGEVEVFHLNHKSGKSVVLRVLKEGDCFGQLGFFTEQDRNFHARSKGFSSLYTLRREDFLDIIKNTPEDFENFHYIKDNIHLYGDINKLEMKCESCGNLSHLLVNCPYVRYVPNRDLIIRRHLHSIPNERGKTLRKQQRTPNALYIKKYMEQGENLADHEEGSQSEEYERSSFSFPRAKTIGEQDFPGKLLVPESKEIEKESESFTSRDLGGQSESHSRIFEAKFDESPLLKKRTLILARGEKSKKTVVFPKNDEASLEGRIRGRSLGRKSIIMHIPEEDDESLKPSPHPIIGLMRPIDRRSRVLMRKNTIITNKSEQKEELAKQHSLKSQGVMQPQHIAAQHHLNVQGSHNPEQPENFFDKNIALIFGGLNIDCLRSFSLYYPYNNCEYIIQYMRKFKFKRINQGIKSSKSNSNNNEKLNKANVGGLIEFRNQQRYFMKNKNVLARNKTIARSPKKVHSVFKKSSDNFTFFPKN